MHVYNQLALVNIENYQGELTAQRNNRQNKNSSTVQITRISGLKWEYANYREWLRSRVSPELSLFYSISCHSIFLHINQYVWSRKFTFIFVISCWCHHDLALFIIRIMINWNFQQTHGSYRCLYQNQVQSAWGARNLNILAKSGNRYATLINHAWNYHKSTRWTVQLKI